MSIILNLRSPAWLTSFAGMSFEWAGRSPSLELLEADVKFASLRQSRRLWTLSYGQQSPRMPRASLSRLGISHSSTQRGNQTASTYPTEKHKSLHSPPC